MTMKKTVLLLLLTASACLSAAYRNTELLWEADFRSAGALKRWTDSSAAQYLPAGGPDGSPAVAFVLPKRGTRWMSIGLDPAKLRGLIQLEAVVRGKELTRGPQPYFGSKVMLAISAGGKTRHPEPLRRYGTYGWTKVCIVENIPDNADKVTLSLGIQNASGTFEVAGVRIFRCVETDDPSEGKPAVNAEAQAIPRGPGKGAKFRGFMSGGDLSPEAVGTLAEWNVNLIRYQMNPGLNVKPKADISTPEKYLAWIDSEIKRLDELMPLFREHGIKVAIDLHTGPGTGISQVASNILGAGTSLDTLDAAWRKLASHYRGNPQIYGYDLLNEPVAENYVRGVENPWLAISERLVRVIREVDPDTPIITEPDFANTRPLADRNVIYSPHFYSPHAYTHQGVLGQVRWSYPGVIDGVYWDKEQLRVSMKEVNEFQKKHGVPIFVGEFSVINWAKGGDRYLADMIELFEEYGWDWAYHAFREWDAWSIEHEGKAFRSVVPSPDNPRKRVLLEALKKNTR